MIKFLSSIDLKFKFNLFFLIILMLFAAILEMIGLSILPVIISQVISGETANNLIISNLFNYVNLEKNFSFFLLITIFFFFFKNLFLAFVYFYELKFVYKIRKFNAEKLFSYYLFLPFSEYTKKNSSEFIKNISIENHNGCSSIMYALVLVRESFVLIFIALFLLFSAPNITIFSLCFLLSFLSVWIFFIRKKIYKIGELSKKSRSKFYKNLNESFNSFKEIKIFSIENKVIKEFIKNFSFSEKYVLIDSYIGKLPRLILETIIVLLLFLILIFYFVDQSGTLQNSLDVLILLSIASLRLIPCFSTLSSSYLKMRFTKPALETVYREILSQNRNLRKKSSKNLNKNSKFNKFINLNLKNISFSYDDSEKVIKNFTLEINQGDKILIQGESGSGKTTLINLISGLLKPTEGKILINNVDENETLGKINIGYVSQNIYLIDDSIENNIKFNSDLDDANVLDEVIDVCKISSFLDAYKRKEYNVGEAGSMLSGGQRQRIALARALYNKPDLLILDEGTNGIDIEMEKEILNNIINKNRYLTLIFISHRKNNYTIFNKNILVEKNKIKIS